MDALRFGHGNAKLSEAITTFSLVAGHSCPAAKDCLSKADRLTGRLTDGPSTEFRCYAATVEARYPSVRRARWHNYAALRRLKTSREITQLILDSLSPLTGYVRWHDSGDFYNLRYVRGFLDAASQRPRTTFYFYSKALNFWVKYLNEIGTGHEPGSIKNVVPTASLGGRHDQLAYRHGLRTARVVYTVDEADRLGLLIDHSDSYAMQHGPDFALLLHGQQPKGSAAQDAAKALKETGWYGYGKSSSKISLLTV